MEAQARIANPQENTEAEDEKAETGDDTKGSTAGSDSKDEDETINTLEPKFYLFDEEIAGNGAHRSDRTETKGSFSSLVDTKDLIRVAYGFESIHLKKYSRRTVDRLPPNSKIVCVRIDSAPISSFLGGLLGLDISKDDIIELSAPFRILLQNIDEIRQHQAELEERFASVTPGKQRMKKANE